MTSAVLSSSSVELVTAKSSELFTECAWPIVGPLVGGGEIIPCETCVDSRLRGILDMKNSIDHFQHVSELGVRGIASRCQQNSGIWASITVRTKTRYGKRTEWHKLIDGEWLGPHLHIHSYFTAGRLCYVAAVETRDLIRFMHDKYLGDVYTIKENHEDGNNFAAFWVPALEAHGVNVHQPYNWREIQIQPVPRGITVAPF